MLCHLRVYDEWAGPWVDVCTSCHGDNGHWNRVRPGGECHGRSQRRRQDSAVHLWKCACEREGREPPTHSSLVGTVAEARI
jgi:hypothetical protein